MLAFNFLKGEIMIKYVIYGAIMLFIFLLGIGSAVLVFTKKYCIGSLILNLSRDDKDIAQFVIEKPLSDFSNGDWAVLRVKTNGALKSLSEYESQRKQRL